MVVPVDDDTMSYVPDDRPKTWFDEFRAEVISDHRQLLACRAARKDRGDWSFDHARKRTQRFYEERLNGYHKVSSISAEQLQSLLTLVAAMGTTDFPDR